MEARQRIGILSDMYRYTDGQACKAPVECDLISRVEDIGSPQVLERLQAIVLTLAVYGDIDDAVLYTQFSKVVHTEVAGVELVMAYTDDYPRHYECIFAPYLTPRRGHPMITISGYSHILKITPDKFRPGLLHINPGAAGRSGWHQNRILIRLQITAGRPHNLEVVEQPH